MKMRHTVAFAILTVLALPVAAEAQGVVRGARDGAAVGNRTAGPIGGAVGGVVGGVTGGVVGGVRGVVGAPQRASRTTVIRSRTTTNRRWMGRDGQPRRGVVGGRPPSTDPNYTGSVNRTR